MADSPMVAPAAHRVLNITELLDLILSFVYFIPEGEFLDSSGTCRGSNDNLIAAYSAGLLRVNRLWFSVAVKYIWRRCGYYPGPKRFDLGKLAMGPMRYIPPTLKAQSERLQFYADFIEEFNFEEEIDIRSDAEKSGHMARLETLLPELELSRIHSISMTGVGIRLNEKPNVLSFALPFLRPSLRDLSITVTNLPSLLWTTLRDRCPQLERLAIHQWDAERPNPTYIADEACRAFLGTTTSLKTFHLEHKRLWSQTLFSTIASITSLVELVCGLESNFVNQSWIEDLEMSKSEFIPFKSLRALTLWTTSGGLDFIAPWFKSVTSLTVRLDQGLVGQHCFNFHHLSNLQHFHLDAREDYLLGVEDTIEARVLLSLAQSCPQLKTLTIGDHNNNPLLDSFTDEIISTITLCLPNLQTFRLCGAFSQMTEASILAFGSNCKALTSLKISTSFDIVQLARSGAPRLFPALKCFCLRQDQYKEFGSTLESEADVKDIASRLAGMMPRVTEFELYVWLSVKGAAERFSLDDTVKEILGIPKATEVDPCSMSRSAGEDSDSSVRGVRERSDSTS